MNNHKNYTTSAENRKDFLYMLCGVIAIGILIGVALAAMMFSVACADGERWVLCQPKEMPGGYLNIREQPKKDANIEGWLFLGDQVETDGKTKNGFTHIINASTESGDGWVASRYLMEIPVKVATVTGWIDCNGRVAARQQPGGKRNRWMYPGDEVTVYAYGAEWTLTNKGFIRSEYVLIGE